jgi:hypothetical protein
MALAESAGAACSPFPANANTAVTGSYPPAANSLQVAIVTCGNGDNFAWTSLTVTDSVSGSWTRLVNVLATTGAGVQVWVKDAGSSPPAQTVTATASMSGTAEGLAIQTRQFTGAAPAASQTGVTAAQNALTAYTKAITPGTTGSQVVGAFGRSTNSVTLTANGSTTIYSQGNGSGGDTECTFKATSLSTSGTPVTVGFTNAAGGSNCFALAEILPASNTTSSGSITLAPMTPAGTAGMPVAITASGSLAQAPMVPAGSGAGGDTGASGSAAMAPMALAGSAAEAFTASGTVALASPGLAGTEVTAAVTGTGSMGLASMGMAGAASGPVTSSGSLALAPLASAGIRPRGVLLAFPF